MKLIFATHNQHKTEEVRAIAGTRWSILNLYNLGCLVDIPETADSLKGNALQKAQYVVEHYGMNCFADDTGLEIEVLDGRPGVYSARYAGEQCSFEDNIRKVLEELRDKENRKACFKTVIALILEGEPYFFEGRVDGIILKEKRGVAGFGYDPVFLPDGYTQTFAEMPATLKNKISHRGMAIRQLMDFLNRKYHQ